MTEVNLCIHCGRPCPDGYADSDCAYQAGDRLHDIADMMLAARDIATGEARHGSGGSSGTESRIPLNLGATQRLNAVDGSLAGWARHVAGTRGVELPHLPAPLPPMLGPLCRTREHCWHDSCKPIRDPGRPTVHITTVVAEWLAGHVEWIRHRPECEEFLTDVELCHRVVRGLARGPSEQKFLGPCGAALQVEAFDDDQLVEGDLIDTCEGDVYAYRGAKKGRCKACKAEVATSEREAWLDGEVRQHAFRASQIADAYGVNVNTIRSWAARGQLKSYWRTELGLTVEWVDPVLDDRLEGDELKQRLGEISDEIQARGGRLHYVGDVLDLAAADAARRATEQAKRARRAAAKAAESEDAA